MLTNKQTAFVDEYCINGFNAVQACLTAGYSHQYAYHKSSQLVGKSSIKEALKEKQAETAEKTGITKEIVVDKVLLLANHCLGPLIDENSTKQVDSAGAARALEMLCKHVGAFEADNSQRDASFRDIIQQLGRKAVQSRSVPILEDSSNKPKETE